MGKCNASIEEVRFDLRDPDLTHVYVISRAEGDCPLGVEGCHHKAFPSSMPVWEIVSKGHIAKFLEWDLGAPDERADRLEAMVDRMAERLSEYVLLEGSMRELCHEIEQLPASEQQTKVSLMASDLHKKIVSLKTYNDQSTHQS